jgi:hypothetical protein
MQNCNLPFCLYGCETWPRTLSEEHRLRFFENRVSRKILGPQRDEATGPGRDFVIRGLLIWSLLLARYYVGDQMKEEKIGRICSTNGKKNMYRVMAGEHKGKKTLARSRLRWDDNITIECESVNWINVTAGR